MRVECIAPALMPGTEKVLDERVMNRAVRGTFLADVVPILQDLQPPKAFLFQSSAWS